MREAVEVAPSLREVALRLKAAEPALWKATRRNLVVAVQPARPAIRASARETLPKAGGLNDWVASASITTQVLTGARSAGVRLKVSKKGHDMKDVDAGTVRHPTFGNRKSWSEQNVPPGFASKPVKQLTPAITASVLLAMRQAALAAGFK